MKQRLVAFLQRPIIRNVSKLAAGTAGAQVIMLAFSPLLTRLYGPEAYGIQGVFLSLVATLGTLATLGYSMAIVLPREDVGATALAHLSIYIGLLAALLLAITLYFAGPAILSIFGADAIIDVAYLLPLAIFGTAIQGVLGQWLIRKKAFGFSATISVATIAVLCVLKAGLGAVFPTAISLIAINTLGGIVCTALAYVSWRRTRGNASSAQQTKVTSDDLLKFAKRHRDFAFLRTPQNLINAFSQSLPILLLATFFGAASAGHYSVALALLGAPAGLIGNSVLSVFYPRITEAIYGGEDARSLIIQATKLLAIAGALPFILVMAIGPELFAFVFGDQWAASGQYARWLAPFFFFQYINKPAVAAIPALGLQGGLLVYELFSTGTKVLALYIGFKVLKNDISAIALFSITGIAAYAWLILWVISRSRIDANNHGSQARNSK